MGKYTGCHINESCGLKLEDAGPKCSQIQTGKIEASTRRLAPLSDIKQLVETLVQNSTYGYLPSGLSCSNSEGDGAKVINKTIWKC